MAGMSLKAELFSLDEKRAKNVVKKFIDTVMRTAVRVFLKAFLAKIPVRTGFLKGAFRELGTVFDARTASRGNNTPAVDIEYEVTKKGSNVTYTKTAKISLSELFGSENVRALFKESEAEFKTGKHLPPERRESHKRKEAFAKKAFDRLNASKGGRKEYYTGNGSKILKTASSGVPFVTKPEDVLKASGTKIEFNLEVDISYYRVMDFYGRRGNGPWGATAAGEAAMIRYLQVRVAKINNIVSLLGKTTITYDGGGKTKTTIVDFYGKNTFLADETAGQAGLGSEEAQAMTADLFKNILKSEKKVSAEERARQSVEYLVEKRAKKLAQEERIAAHHKRILNLKRKHKGS